MTKKFYNVDENSIILASYYGEPWIGRLVPSTQFYYWVRWNGSKFGDKCFVGDIERSCKDNGWKIINSEKELLNELLKFK
jgi:hypothetical protein